VGMGTILFTVSLSSPSHTYPEHPYGTVTLKNA